jgi:hypothetical protein
MFYAREESCVCGKKMQFHRLMSDENRSCIYDVHFATKKRRISGEGCRRRHDLRIT